MNQAIFDSTYSNLPYAVLICSASDLSVIYRNPKLYALFGGKPETGVFLWDVIDCADRATGDLFIETLRKKRFVKHFSLPVRTKASDIQSVIVTANTTIGQPEDAAFILYIEPQPKCLQKVFRTVLDQIEMPIYVSDFETHELLFVNQFLHSNLMETQENPEGKPCWSVLQKDRSGPCPWCPNPRLLENPDRVYKWEFQNTVTDRWFLITDSIIDWTDGRKVHMETATDITELKKNEERLQHYASIDHMTGAYNREWGYRMLDETLQKSLSTGVLSCLCFLDLDGLKAVNDLHGHDEGDNLIISLVHAIRIFSRGADVLCRWGGDEFLLCLYDCSENQAIRIMKKIEEEFVNLQHANNRPYKHKFSYGIVEIWPERGYASVDKLISQADELMYLNKTTKDSPHQP